MLVESGLIPLLRFELADETFQVTLVIINLGVQIIVRCTIINSRIFSQPYFLIWDRTIIEFEKNEIQCCKGSLNFDLAMILKDWVFIHFFLFF